ncbi:carbamoyl phosphate synthase small subunit, partial [Candidatus Magnetobacterium bavaricum]
MNRAILVLADGMVFEGEAFGAVGEAVGEVVFNTAMSGYQEILTDPSYTGQIVTMTYTQIGNYGINPQDIESMGGPKVEGFIVKESFEHWSNWRANQSIGDYLRQHNIVAISGIDTRALTAHLRTVGAMMAIISTRESDPRRLYQRIKGHAGIGGVDLVKDVTTREPYHWSEGLWSLDSNLNTAPTTKNQERPGARKRVVVYDFGVKLNILRSL